VRALQPRPGVIGFQQGFAAQSLKFQSRWKPGAQAVKKNGCHADENGYY